MPSWRHVTGMESVWRTGLKLLSLHLPAHALDHGPDSDLGSALSDRVGMVLCCWGGAGPGWHGNEA